MLQGLAIHLWDEDVNTAYHIVNRVYLKLKIEKILYEMGRNPTIKYFRVFGRKYYILRDRDNLSKFDFKSNEGIFVGYSRNSGAYLLYTYSDGIYKCNF